MSEGIRINKYLSESGFCSRRKADEYIASGIVTIDGRPALTGDRVMPGQTVKVRGKVLSLNSDKIWIMLYKPRGIICSARSDEANVIDYLGIKERVFYVGRLDKESEGLLLLTNDGENANLITKARYEHEKEYLVTTDKDITEDFIKGMSEGVPVNGTITRKCKVEKVDRRRFRIILTQGLNRQIRYMCEYFGYRVRNLKRIRIMDLKLGDLEYGKWRYLTKEETEKLISRLNISEKGRSDGSK